MEYKHFNFSDCLSNNINIIRILTIQIIVISHGLENIHAIGIANPIGVACFNLLMLISGLLISYSTLTKKKEESYDFRKFYIRRFSRIYPVFITVLIIIVFLDGLNKYNFFHHFDTFVATILLLNNSALGISYYGANRHLWILPLLWWLTLLFGWLLIGFRNTKKKYIYFIVLGFFSIIVIINLYTCFRTFSLARLYYLIVWFIGASFPLLISYVNNYIERKSIKDGGNEKVNNNLEKKFKYGFLCLSIIFFILSSFYLNNPYGLIFNLLFANFIIFLLAFSQFIHFTYPKKVKKVINSLASYSFTFFLFHLTLFNLFLSSSQGYSDFIFFYIIANVLSFSIALLTEMRAPQINKYLLKKFNLDTKVKK